MPARLNTSAGTVAFAAVADPDWQAVGGNLSGDWSNMAHWSGDAVPGINDDVVISDDGTATAAWTVTETNESAAALTLAMQLGTLVASGGLTVANTLALSQGTMIAGTLAEIAVGALTQTGGTLFADALSDIALGTVAETGAFGSFVQAGGTLVLDDDGESDTSFTSEGTDTVDGQVTLVNGANWIDQGLFIGSGLPGSVSEATAAFTLEGGLAPAQLVVALGSMQIGGDPGSGSAGGSGSLEIDNGSGVTADSLLIVNHSAISIDASSFLVIGPAASANPGAVAVEGGAEVQADIATFDASMVNDGTLAVTPWQGDDTTAPGDVLITGSLFSGDAVTVDALSTLAVAGFVEVTAGSVSVGSGGTLQADTGSGSFGIFLEGGALTLDGGTLQSSGTGDFANSNATLQSGGLWSTNRLAIAPGASGDVTTSATVALSGGSKLTDGSTLFVGNDPSGDSAGGVGSLLLSGSSEIQAGTVFLLGGSLISLDTTSTVLVGSAPAVAGAVVIAAGQELGSDTATVDGNVADAGTLAVSGSQGGTPGDLTVSGSLAGTGDVFVTGTLALANATGFAGTIAIVADGELILNAGDMPDAFVAASSGSVSIDVAGQDYDPTGFSPTYNAETGQLVFGDAESQSTLDFGPGRSLGAFSLAADGDGTLVTTEVPCFASGTRIATARGDIAVEVLTIGDLVRTEAGRLAPVHWIGWRRVDCRQHPHPERVWPVRIRADAFAPGRPRRDVLLSPDHAVFWNGVLIPARYLLNGATVARQSLDRVTYWHVELERHGVLLAEGLPCESYLDTGNRAAFTNGDARVDLHPDFARRVWAAEGCAPLATEGAAVMRARRLLLRRARALGHHVSAQPALQVFADGQALRAKRSGRRWQVRLPERTGLVHLRSRCWVPAEMQLAGTDTRRLGVAISRLWLDGRLVTLESPGLMSGWHATEPGWRWTDGDAALAPAGARTLAFELAVTGRYWSDPALSSARAA